MVGNHSSRMVSLVTMAWLSCLNGRFFTSVFDRGSLKLVIDDDCKLVPKESIGVYDRDGSFNMGDIPGKLF